MKRITKVDREKYARYLNSANWDLLRKQISERCNGMCERCATARMEHVHHLTYQRIFEEKLDDLAGLCGECHDLVHAGGDWLEERPIWYAFLDARARRLGFVDTEFDFSPQCEHCHLLPGDIGFKPCDWCDTCICTGGDWLTGKLCVHCAPAGEND